MTADEWDTSTNPEAMLTALADAKFSTARLPVVLAGVVERGRVLPLNRDLQQPFTAYGRWVFGLGARPLPIELPVFDPLTPQSVDGSNLNDIVKDVLRGVFAGWLIAAPFFHAEVVHDCFGSVFRHGRTSGPEVDECERWQADALRDALGNPFDPVAWEPTWRSETVVALATGIHFDNAFDRLPILADALEEAGCDHPDVLTHCRGPGPHARGCWVVDAARGR